MSIFLDILGFHSVDNSTIISELSWYCPQTNKSGCYNFWTTQECKNTEWVMENFHGLHPMDGKTNHHFLPLYFNFISDHYSNFYVKGEEKAQIIESYIKKPVLNLRYFPKICELPSLKSITVCEIHKQKNPKFYRMCSLYKINQIARYYKSEHDTAI
jgi:hypothetical protein